MLKVWAYKRSVTLEPFWLDSRFAQLSKSLSTGSIIAREYTELDHSAARQWLAKFDINTIPRSLGEVTFSRSSGAGGQNVNKVNSKATARFKMKDLVSLVPGIVHQQLRKTQYYAPKSETLVIQADGSRKQSENVNQCFQVLRDLILNAGKIAVKGETSPEQKSRVKNLQRAANEKRLQAKGSHSSKKRARKFGSSD